MHFRFVTGVGLAIVAAVAQGANLVLEGPVGFAGVAGKGKVVVSVDIPETDVTPYDRMLVDVVNEGPEEDEVNVHLATADMKPDTGPYIGAGMRQRHWAPVGRSTWTVDLRKWYGTGDPKKIAKLHFFCYRPFGSTMRLSRIRFLKSQEEDVPSVRVPAEEARLADLAKAAASRREAAHREAFDSFRRSCAAIGLPTDRMLVGTATAMDQIRPTRPESFARVSPARAVAVRLAKDECESFQVLVTPVGAALKNVSVALGGDLEGECGTFAASNVACCVTGYVKTRGVASYTVGETVGDPSAEGGYRRVIANPVPGWWADPILSFQRSADVASGVLQSFWVRVKCPRRQAAGTYRGGLVVSSDGVPSLRIPLSVRVNSFAVPRDSQLPLAITFGPSLNKYFETSVEAEVYEHIVKDSESPYNAWRRHREEWSDFLADYLLSVDNLYYTEIKPNRDFDLRARQVARGHRSWTNLGYWGEAGEGEKYEKYFNETLLPLYRSAYDEAKRIGLGDRAYLYGADEIGPDKIERAAKAVRRLKEALPGVPVMTTARDGKYGVGNALSCVDIFVPLTRWYDPVQADKARAEGRKVYWYIADGPENGWANCNIENPVGDLRLLMGAQTVRMRPDGFLFWQVSRWASPRPITSGPFTDWETRTWILWNGQGYWTTVGPDGVPLPTLRLENFRDGLEDYAYAVLLRHKLKTATDAGWVAKANELLSVPTSVMKKMDDYSDLPTPVYAWRDAMADLLESAQ